MPMFYTPKPRQFHYEPRFYDPEKEKWEALKQKYADQKEAESRIAESAPESSEKQDSDLAYFQNKVRQMDREERHQSAKFGMADLFRKREMPTFNYQPRFNEDGSMKEPASDINLRRPSQIKIRRRFDVSDTDYMKPVSGGKIILYTLLACMLLYWILF